MKSGWFWAVLFWVPLVSGAEAPRCPMGEDWVFCPEFSDEFDGEKLDETRWWDFNPTFYGRPPGLFARDNVAVKEGKLHLTARVLRPEEKTVENRERGYDRFATAIVKGKKRVCYGYFEARCKSMKAGVCNAFWLYDPLDPPKKFQPGSFSEEIDIFEVFGKPTRQDYDRLYCMNVHRFRTPYFEAIVNFDKEKLENKSRNVKVDFDFWADYHVYGFLWTPEKMVWYVDGNEVFSRDNDFYHTPLRIMLDCEIMRGWTGEPDPADLPATFSIDYVRVWQQPK
ncbi:MAG: family 16 glycosylhydrolase [Planctomycetia bacterium]|nr:family 16 glycosylhydrolase [Planctomycetia bacterium]